MSLDAYFETVSLRELVKLLRKNKFVVVNIIIVILIIGLLIYFVVPAQYKSTSVVWLGSVGNVQKNNVLYSGSESKKIIESSTILSDIVAVFPGDKSIETFKQKNLSVKVVVEQVSIGSVEQLPMLEIAVKSKNPELSKKTNEEIISKFLSYIAPLYDKKISYLHNRISESEAEIINIQKEIISLQNKLTQYSDSATLEQAISNYKQIIESEKISLNKTKDVLDSTEEYGVISYPEVPTKRSNLGFLAYLSVSFILGLFISLAYIIYLKKS